MRSYNVKVNGKAYYVEIEEADEHSIPSLREADTPVVQKTETKTVNASAGTKVAAPMPGLILTLNTANGAIVKKGDKIIVLEAMKMEHDVFASADGIITYAVKKGDNVSSGATLAYIK